MTNITEMGRSRFSAKTGRLAQAALEIARTQLGVMEKPHASNDGPEVRKYLKSVGLPGGYAWCMAFVYWCMQEAAKNTGISNPLLKTGGVLRQFNEAKSNKRIVKFDSREQPITPDMVKEGDIFIISFSSGLGHTGIVKQVTGSSIITYEGNTNKGGSREGIGVFERRRKLSELRGILRVLD